jgi:FHA domain
MLAPCPHCATRVPEDGAYCDSCGRQLAACATCGELAKPGEKCIKHGVAAMVRPSAAPGAKPVAVGPVAGPTVMPPPRRAAPAPPASPPPVPSGTSAPPAHGGQATTVQVLARKLRLVVTSGEPLVSLEVDPEAIFGRGEGPFALLLDPFHNKGVSRRHCQFRRGPTGTWSIVDLAGKGTTWVSPDGSFAAGPMSANGTQALEPGRDHIRLGSLSFRVEAIA